MWSTYNRCSGFLVATFVRLHPKSIQCHGLGRTGITTEFRKEDFTGMDTPLLELPQE